MSLILTSQAVVILYGTAFRADTKIYPFIVWTPIQICGSVSSLEIGAAQLRSATEFAPQSPFLCVKSSLTVYSYFEKGCGWFLVHCFSKKFQTMAREAMDVCLRVLKESNKSRFDSYSIRNSVLIISHITFWDCRVHSFSDNLSRNSCIRYGFRAGAKAVRNSEKIAFNKRQHVLIILHVNCPKFMFN